MNRQAPAPGCNLTLAAEKLSFAVCRSAVAVVERFLQFDVALLLTPGRLGDQQAPAPWLQSPLSSREVVIREFADQRLQLLERFLQFDVALLLTPGRLGDQQGLLLDCNLTLSSREVVIRGLQISGCSC